MSVQQALAVDGLVGPFWAETHHHGHTRVEHHEILHDLLTSCFNQEEVGAAFVQKIGDEEGLLWERRPAYDFTWEAKSDRAPWPSPYKEWGE